MRWRLLSGGPTAEQGLIRVGGSLVSLGEEAQTLRCLRNILVSAQHVAVETTTLHELKLVKQYIADGSQLTAVPEPFTQQTANAVTTAIDKAREIHRDQWQFIHFLAKQFRLIVAVKPDTHGGFSGKVLMAGQPQICRNQDRLIFRNIHGFTRRRAGHHNPVVITNRAVSGNYIRHIPAP